MLCELCSIDEELHASFRRASERVEDGFLRKLSCCELCLRRMSGAVFGLVELMASVSSSFLFLVMLRS